MGWFCTLLKLVPLGIYVRSVACKYELPVLGCDTPLCPVATGAPAAEHNCTPTANTAEVKAWCEYGWTPWLNGLIGMASEKAGVPAPITATCTEAEGYQLLKIVGAMEAFGYVMLWLRPQFGAFFLTVFMGFGLHFHFRHLKEGIADTVLQLVLFCSSFLVLYLEMDKADNAPAPPSPAAKKKPFGSKKPKKA